MSTVTYRGKLDELQGTSWEVPSTVISAGQAASWIESQHRQQLAEDAARAEAAKRQQELLAARLEQQRLAAEADAATPTPSRDELKAELQAELDQLSQSVIAAGAAISGRGEAEAAARAEWEGRHEQLLSGAEAAIATAQEQVQAAQAVTQASSEQVQAELDNHRRELRSLESELRETVSTLQGPQGEVGPIGLAGASTVIAAEDPLEVDPTSFANRWLGRGLIDGDGALVVRPTEILVRRWVNGAWSAGPSIAPKVEVRDVKASILDNSTKAFPTVAAAAGGGGGGTGGEPLLVNRAALSTGVMIADSSNWAGVSDPTSGQLVIEIVALDGTLQGRRGFACIDFTWQPSGAQDSQAGILGDLAGTFDLNLSYQRVAATAPAGLGISMPAATQALQVFATVVPDPGGGGVGGVTQFRISGDLEWAHQSLAQAVPLNSNTGLKPLWRWV